MEFTMNKKHLITGLLSFTALATFTVATDVQGAMMEGSGQNNGQQMRAYAGQNHHQKEEHHRGASTDMHAEGWDGEQHHSEEAMAAHMREGNHNGHHQSGDLPEGIQEAVDPAYAIGEKVILEVGHMPGMEGARAKIVGAYDTVAYEVTYQPTDGGPLVENHKWVVQEEILEAGEEPLEPGTEVTLEADHMPGMEGATATIEAAVETTVYVINYKPTDGGPIVRNHKWFTGEELTPAPDKGNGKNDMRNY